LSRETSTEASMEEIKEGYTRVSSILGQWNHLAHIDKDVLANKCRIGTNVHAKIGAEIDGIFLDLEADEEGYFESWNKWQKEERLDYSQMMTEERFYCDELKITGCVDAIRIEEERGTLLDYKTSATPNKRMWALQAAFYHYLVKKSGKKIEDEVWFIHLKKDGKVAKVYNFEITPKLWEVCASALHSYRYFNG